MSGTALVSVLIMLAALTPLAAFAVMNAHLDVLVQHQVRQAASAFAVAESGLQHALADLRLDSNFDRLLAGPDHLPGTSDDGQFPFRGAPGPLPIERDYRYDVRVSPRSATSVDLVSTATGPRLATHVVAARVARERALLPAAVSTTAKNVTLDLGARFRVTGTDRAGRDPAQPGLVVAGSDIASMLRERLPSEPATRMSGAGSIPSIAERAAPVVEDVATAFATSRRGDVGPMLNGAIGPGVVVSSGSIEIGNATGSGVLIVNGNLRVSGALAFSGLVIALGDVLFEAPSVVHVFGGLLQGRGNGLLAFLGDGEIAYDSRVIEQIDTTFPGRLGHRARVIGWRDLS